MLTFNTTLVKKEVLPGDVDLLRFTLKAPQEIKFTAGQYVVLTVPHEVLPVKRLYSIASPPSSASFFELLIKRVPGGIASNYVERLAIGQPVDFQGPAGLFTLKDNPHDKVFLATGTGIAPIRSFLLSNRTHTQHYYLLWGVPTAAELYLLDELKECAAKDPLFHIMICLSREQTLDMMREEDRPLFSLGHINECVEKLRSANPQTTLEYYICGRREMVESMREYLYNQHIDKEFVHFERY